jgi:putative inorganic carbon (hco3(-)) transporter
MKGSNHANLLNVSTLMLVAFGPILLFPEIVPVGWRTPAVVLISLAALAFAPAVMERSGPIRWALAAFVMTVIASWVVRPAHDAVALRHFSGIALGVLVMAVTAARCTTRNRLVAATIVFAVATVGVLAAGLIGAYITRTKLLLDYTQQISTEIYPWLPRVKFGLPGLERTEGWVHANALAGTALLFLPMCCGLIMAALTPGRHRWLMLISGLMATSLATVVIGMTHSRTAILAGVLTLILLGLRWPRGRWWVLSALFVATMAAGVRVLQTRAAAPDNFAEGMRLAIQSLSTRFEIWGQAIERISEKPLLGVGINAFHDIASNRGLSEMYVAHAHNMLIQVALDVGLLGLAAYVALIAGLLFFADRAARASDVVGPIAAGAGMSLVAVHVFGLGDAIALGAKVGGFQWFCGGLILAASQLAACCVEGTPASSHSATTISGA